MRSARMRPTAILSAVVALLLLLPAALPAAAQDASSAPAADGQALATRFMDILGIEDAAQKASDLEAFLADEFQVVRANGDRVAKADYLQNAPTVHEFTISDVITTQDRDILVVSYMLSTTETIDGVEQTSVAPRLSVFHWDAGAWELAAHSNFGAISVTQASPAPSGGPSA